MTTAMPRPIAVKDSLDFDEVSKAVGKEVNKFAKKNGLDDTVRQKLCVSSDEATLRVIRYELSSRVNNANGYVTRLLQGAERDVASGRGAELEPWGGVGGGVVSDGGAGGYEGADDDGAWHGDDIDAEGHEGAANQEGCGENEAAEGDEALRGKDEDGDEGGYGHGWQDRDGLYESGGGGWHDDENDEATGSNGMTRVGMMMLAGTMNNGEGMQIRTCRFDEVARWVRSVSRVLRLV